MLVTIVAVLCSLSLPQAACVEEIVMDSNLDPGVTLQGCQMSAQSGIAKWMSESPIYHARWRLDRWKCVPGHYEVKGQA